MTATLSEMPLPEPQTKFRLSGPYAVGAAFISRLRAEAAGCAGRHNHFAIENSE
jgi:hypothetical protein